MNILLIDADSKIPNIALCKLSTYHKSLGDSVTLLKLNIPYYPNTQKHKYVDTIGYDSIYCSVIFSQSNQYIHGDNIRFGGTGHDLITKLPEEIEQLDCDYSIYPENDTSYGFISRGCIRKCYFCKVPEKEGGIHQVATIDKIVRHTQVKFMDNNILALPNHLEILQELVDKQIKCTFFQGLDIRLINKENSRLLAQIKYYNNYIFALDDVKLIPVIKEKYDLFLQWIHPWRSTFYIYVHPSMKLSETVSRIEFLKSQKILPYIMRDLSCWGSENSDFYVDIAAWCNQPHIFRTHSFAEYIIKRHSRLANHGSNTARIQKSKGLYYGNK